MEVNVIHPNYKERTMPNSEKLPVTVCMIVRNEETNLSDAIDSVSDVVSEIVVIDTGSYDKTREIAKDAGCNLFDFTWIDDFAAARNFALSKATQPWILSLDADQRLPKSSVSQLRQVIHQNIDSAVVHIETYDANNQLIVQYPALRLFRADPRISYSGRVHESIDKSIKRNNLIHTDETKIVIHDFGYGSAEARLNKKKRNLELLRQAYQSGESDLYLTYKYLQTISDSNERKKVVENTRANLNSSKETKLEENFYIDELVYWCALDLLNQGQLKEAQEFSTRMAKIVTGYSVWTAGMVSAKAGDFFTAEKLLTTYENECASIHPFRKKPTECSVAMAGFWRAWGLRLQGEFDRALQVLTQYEKKASPSEMELFQYEKSRIHLSSGNLQNAAKALTNFISQIDTARHLNEIRMVAAEISSQLELYDQTQMLLNQCSEDDERKNLMRALLAFYQSDYELAKKHLSSVIGTDCLNSSLKQELWEAIRTRNKF